MKETHRIPDIIDEQEAAFVLESEAGITLVGREADRHSRHYGAQAMAEEIGDYLDCVLEQMQRAGLNGADHVAKLKDYATQLRCHHLSLLATINYGEQQSPEGFRVAPGTSFVLALSDDGDPWELQDVTVLELLPGDRVRVARTEDVVAAVLTSATTPQRTIARREVPVSALF